MAPTAPSKKRGNSNWRSGDPMMDLTMDPARTAIVVIDLQQGTLGLGPRTHGHCLTQIFPGLGQVRDTATAVAALGGGGGPT